MSFMLAVLQVVEVLGLVAGLSILCYQARRFGWRLGGKHGMALIDWLGEPQNRRLRNAIFFVVIVLLAVAWGDAGLSAWRGFATGEPAVAVASLIGFLIGLAVVLLFVWGWYTDRKHDRPTNRQLSELRAHEQPYRPTSPSD